MLPRFQCCVVSHVFLDSDTATPVYFLPNGSEMIPARVQELVAVFEIIYCSVLSFLRLPAKMFHL